MGALAAGALVLCFAGAAAAARQTVCTITVNSPDEREVLRAALDPAQFEFVELAQPGERDWLGSACRRQVQCDLLVVSGHFAGTAFYSSAHGEHLPVEEMERVACSDSCRGLFSRLKEVYLFGCDTLKPEPVRSATPEIVASLQASGMDAGAAARLARELSFRHGEAARERMRRLFPGVPLIYGFSSLAPYGRVAGPMLQAHLAAGGVHEVGTGKPSIGLLRTFGPASMVATSGVRWDEPEAAFRAESCRFHDERLDLAGRLSLMHAVLTGDPVTARMRFAQVEQFVQATIAVEDAALEHARARLRADAVGRARYLELTRTTRDPALRLRMIAVARGLGWLSPAQDREEQVMMIAELLERGDTGYGEVDLVCALNRDRALDGELGRFEMARVNRPAHAAALACLGNPAARDRVLRALWSGDEAEAQVAQAYLRHRPIGDAAELRHVLKAVAAMKPSPAQARAIEALARLGLAGEESRRELLQLFERSRLLVVQRAIAEVFLRQPGADTVAAQVLRRHRVRSPGGPDVIDAAIARLEPG